MKASELRIGNNIYDNNRTISKINGFRPFDDSVRCDELHGCYILIDLYHNHIEVMDGYECDINYCNPIPLTEELFKKLSDNEWEFIGFGTRLIIQHIMFKSIKIECINDKWAFYFNDELISFKEYLHDSQNLYFSLTGQELILQK